MHHLFKCLTYLHVSLVLIASLVSLAVLASILCKHILMFVITFSWKVYLWLSHIWRNLVGKTLRAPTAGNQGIHFHREQDVPCVHNWHITGCFSWILCHLYFCLSPDYCHKKSELFKNKLFFGVIKSKLLQLSITSLS